MKLLNLLICALLFLQVDARTITEIEKEISALHNEYVKLQQNPIFIWGSKQQNLSEKQKCATSAYNINIAQGKERKLYKTKRVVTLNPEYVCPIHKAIYVSGHCPIVYGCKSEKKIGTGNFCNLGPEYDLSYKTWKLLKAKMQEGVAQEARLKAIEKKIADLRTEESAIQKQRSSPYNSKACDSVAHGNIPFIIDGNLADKIWDDCPMQNISLYETYEEKQNAVTAYFVKTLEMDKQIISKKIGDYLLENKLSEQVTKKIMAFSAFLRYLRLMPAVSCTNNNNDKELIYRCFLQDIFRTHVAPKLIFDELNVASGFQKYPSYQMHFLLHELHLHPLEKEPFVYSTELRNYVKQNITKHKIEALTAAEIDITSDIWVAK